MVRVAFLMSGPTYDLMLDQSLHPVPALESPVELQPGAGRAVSFIPQRFGPPMYGGALYSELEPVLGGDGRTVRVIEHREKDLPEPVQWYLLWDLSQGYLETHVRGEDGFQNVSTTAAHLEVVEPDDSTPMVLPTTPLRRAASADPGYGETITFHGVEDLNREDIPHPFLILTRPGSLRAGSETREGVLTVRTGVGIDIESSGIDEDSVYAISDELMRQSTNG